jgi:hypothetical protein
MKIQRGNLALFKKTVYLVLALSLLANAVFIIRAVRVPAAVKSDSADLAGLLERDIDDLEGRIADSIEGAGNVGNAVEAVANTNRILNNTIKSSAGIAAELGSENSAIGERIEESLAGVGVLDGAYSVHADQYRTIRDRLERLVGTIDQYLEAGSGSPESLDTE